MMNEKFTEYSDTSKKIQMIVETMLIGIGEMYDVHYGMPAHDVARRFLNEIYEFETEREYVIRMMAVVEKEEKENADKSGG
jgi:hypothetical protein